MSSLSRGASGASKPKPVNVNSLYAGRNLAAGAKPLGKHGLTSVGKSVGVVRRMPPPATLPSLKAENNGQDPSTVVVPQGGTGWSKNDTSTDSSEVVKTSSLTTSNGPDLRPIWAKPSSEVLSSGDSSTREFPTLAVAAQGIDGSHRSSNKWAVGDNSHSSEQKTQASASEETHALPSRYCNNVSDSMGGSPHYHSSSERTRFQGSSDARVSHPNYSTSGLCRASQKLSDPITNDVYAACDSGKISVARRDDDRVPQYSQMSRATEFFDGAAVREEVRTEESYSVLEYDRDDAIGKSRHKRTSFRVCIV
ncbi:BAT2 [Ancylostoma caninum]|uniref:BAT2 n=1 Tax=Ancylostoma caninum TaxID=29170 RepID=A0A368FB81_ANCCA|nr:BAT2 [Ancylostoma caninum]